MSLAQAGGFRGVAGMSDELVSTVWRDDMREVMICLFLQGPVDLPPGNHAIPPALPERPVPKKLTTTNYC